MKTETPGLECPVYTQAVKFPDRTAVLTGETSISYRLLESRISHCVVRLREMGIREGMYVGIYLKSSPDYIIVLFALFRLKAIAVPLNTRYPVHTLPEMLSRIRCNHVVGDAGLEKQIKDDRLQIISIDEFTSGPENSYISASPELGHNQPVTVIFSSGSTGIPRAILQAWGNHWFNALGSNINIPLASGDRWLVSLPFYHVAGIAILFRSFIAGSTVVLPDVPGELEEDVARLNITHLSLVATQLKRLLDSTPYEERFSNLKAILVGGSAFPQSLVKEALGREWPVFLTYGLSEMASQVATTPPDAPHDRYSTSGKVLPYRELNCTSDGDILVRGPTLFLGYLVQGQLLKPVDSRGWFRTGDLGQIDEDGWLTITGRKDSLFISGGENIYPEQIERAIEAHPLVQRVMVVPVNDDEFGRRPVAFVESDQIERVKQTMKQFLEGKLPGYMNPIAYLPWNTSPTQSGIKESREAFRIRAEELINKKGLDEASQPEG